MELDSIKNCKKKVFLVAKNRGLQLNQAKILKYFECKIYILRRKIWESQGLNPSTHRGVRLFEKKNDHWGECPNCNLNAYLK